MSMIRRWLFERYFPAAAKVEIEGLRNEIVKRDAEIVRLNAYLDGLEDGIRSQRGRVVIKNEVAK